MPFWANCAPRTMLPPPITSPTPAPSDVTSLISPAIRLRVSKSNPIPLPPASASPEILSNTREYAGEAKELLLLAHLEANEAADLNVLADFGRCFLDQVADRLLRLANPGLIDEAVVLVVRLDFACHHFLDDVRRLAAGLCLLFRDSSLDFALLYRHAVLVDGNWSSAGDVKRYLARESLEVVSACDEI